MCLLSTYAIIAMYISIRKSLLYLIKACHLKLSIRTKVLSPEETKAVSAAVQLASPYEVAEAAMRISSLRNAIKNVFLKEVDKQCSNLCARKSAQPSVLRVPSEHHKSLLQFHWNSILTEMKERAPGVLDFMVAMAVPRFKGSDEGLPGGSLFPWSLPFFPYVPMFPQLFLICSL